MRIFRKKLTKPAITLILVLLLPLLTVACGDDIGSGSVIPAESSRQVAANCNYNDNLDLTADQFIAKCCKGSIRRRFPGDYYGKTLEEIARDSSKDGKTARKLLERDEYRK